MMWVPPMPSCTTQVSKTMVAPLLPSMPPRSEPQKITLVAVSTEGRPPLLVQKRLSPLAMATFSARVQNLRTGEAS